MCILKLSGESSSISIVYIQSTSLKLLEPASSGYFRNHSVFGCSPFGLILQPWMLVLAIDTSVWVDPKSDE